MPKQTSPLLLFIMMGAILFNSDAALSIRVSPNGHYFLDEGGVPWFFQGDTQWELFRGYSLPDVKLLLDKRVAQGFSAFQVMLNGVSSGFSHVDASKPWLNNNAGTPNELYFKRIDSLITVFATYRAVFIIGVYHKSDGNVFTLQSARSYAKFVASRYKEVPNIVWSMYPEAHAGFTEMVRAVATGLREGDGGTHLITVHPDPSPASGSFWQSESWLSFPTLQTYSNDFINYTLTAADYAKTPIKPAVNGESLYEGNPVSSGILGATPQQVRRAALWSHLAGGYYSYGNTQNWENPANWKNWIDSPGAAQMTIIGSFLKSLTWWKLTPDQSIISGSVNERAAARSSDGDWLLVFLPSAGSVTINLGKISAAGVVTASWFNPSNGSISEIGEVPKTGTRTFSTPSGWSDALLYLRTPQTTAATRPQQAGAVKTHSVSSSVKVSAELRRGVMVESGNRLTDAAGRVPGKDPANHH